MSTQNDAIQAAAASAEANFAKLGATLTAIQAGVTALDKQITDLEAKLTSAGNTLSADDVAALQKLVTDSGALVSQAQGISTAPPA